MPLRSFELVSFGCKVNQAEGETLAEGLQALGLRPAAEGAAADLVIVNTCAVTAEAARQSRQRIRRAARAGARVVVTGCCAHPASADASADVAGVWFVEYDKERLLARLRRDWPDAVPPEPSRPASPVHAERSRALLKVQDGCPGACTYCIVRRIRTRLGSMPPETAARRLADLIGAGFREVVLCGVHLGLYGRDLLPRATLVGLLRGLLEAPGLGRLRLSSLEPMEVSDDLLALMAGEPERLCPHLHLPLQSGDDGVLERMARPYRRADYLATVARIRAALPQPAVATDVLVGFPGETDEAFENTLGACREAGFSRMHIFPFSRRPGTPAAEMPDPVPPAEIRRRRERAAELGESLAGAYRQSLVGRPARVVIEAVHADGSAEGTCERYQRVMIRGPLPAGAHRRAIVAVRITAVEGDALLAEPV